MINYEHFIIVISAPSGTGKSTLIKKLLEKYNNIKLSVSCTTRQPREGEVNGVDYYFISQEDFDNKIKNNEFLEYAGVYEKSYGTLKSEIENKNKENEVILDIDCVGKDLVLNQIKDKTKIITIFICPPSIKEVKNRLINRGTDSLEKIEKRMKNIKEIISHYNEYDYFIINDDLELAFNELCSIIEYKRIQNKDKNKIDNFIKNLLLE